MSRFKKAPKSKGFLGQYRTSINKKHLPALSAMGVTVVDKDGKLHVCDLPLWLWLSDLCAENNVHLGDVMEQFGQKISFFCADIAKTPEGRRALQTLSSYWAKTASEFYKSWEPHAARGEAILREMEKQAKAQAKGQKKRAA